MKKPKVGRYCSSGCVCGVCGCGVGMAKKRGIGSPLLSSMILLSGGGDRNSFRVASHSCYMYRQWET